MKLSSENEKKLLSLLSEAIRSKGLPLDWKGLPLDWFSSTDLETTSSGMCHRIRILTYADLLERNGILLADMMCNLTEFPKGFAPVDLGKEYYALIPDQLALKAMTLGHLDLK